MILQYHTQYNFNMGLFNRFHPFDGQKYCRVAEALKGNGAIEVESPDEPTDRAIIDDFLGNLLRRLVRKKRYVLNALGLPFLQFVPFSTIDKRILLPMRWAVQGTIDSTRQALSGKNCWNLGGGYHHASRDSSEGFCIYNDIGIAYVEALKSSIFNHTDRVLIIDVDAHHGNGNAQTFIDNENVFILDIFNDDIYPLKSEFTKARVNIPVPLKKGTSGESYLGALDGALSKVRGDFRVAFVIAGTDVLATDPIGGLMLSIDDVCERDKMILKRLNSLSIPAVFLGGGGYGKNSARATIRSIVELCHLF